MSTLLAYPKNPADRSPATSNIVTHAFVPAVERAASATSELILQ
jgi:hypothetical protein